MKHTAFGKEIRKLRVDHDLSLKMMSDKINISLPHLSAIERGQRNVTLPMFNRITRFFKVKGKEKTQLMEIANKSNTYKLYELPF